MKQITIRIEPAIDALLDQYMTQNFVKTYQQAITNLLVDSLRKQDLNKGGIWPAVKVKKKSLRNQKVTK